MHIGQAEITKLDIKGLNYAVPRIWLDSIELLGTRAAILACLGLDLADKGFIAGIARQFARC